MQGQNISVAGQHPYLFASMAPAGFRVPFTEQVLNTYLSNKQMSEGETECIIHFKCVNSISNDKFG